jgi:hypothetical protein
VLAILEVRRARFDRDPQNSALPAARLASRKPGTSPGAAGSLGR